MRLFTKALLFLTGITVGGLVAKAEDSPRFQLLSTRKLSLDVDRFLENREPMTPDIPMKEYKGRVALNWDVGLLNNHVIWRNRVHGEATPAQFETMGWQFQVAVPVGMGVELTYSHHSQHRLDSVHPASSAGFPVQDAYGLSFCFEGCK